MQYFTFLTKYLTKSYKPYKLTKLRPRKKSVRRITFSFTVCYVGSLTKLQKNDSRHLAMHFPRKGDSVW